MFAIGVAVGFARDGNGAAGLAGVVCFLVASNGAQALMAVPPDAVAGFTGKAGRSGRGGLQGAARSTGSACRWASCPASSPAASTTASARSSCRNTWPSSAAAGSCRSSAGWPGWAWPPSFGFGWRCISGGIDGLSHAIVAAGPLGLFIYGVLNRLLIVTGLHHILNNVAWFIIGDYHGATGDLNRFFAGDPTAGAFMAGFFPVMMFGLPAACLAM